MGRRITLAIVVLLTAGCGGTTDSGVGGGFSGGGATGSGGTPGTGGATGGGGSRSGGAPGSGGAFAGGAPGSGGQGGMGGTGAGGAAACTPPCGLERQCCVDHCVNLQNDPLNCGYCGHQCSAGTYCTGGACVPPDCQTVCTSGTCCGTACCTGGDLCCDPQGPLSVGPVCTAPLNGTCPMGCAPLCVCASPETPIATPGGERPIAALRVGDLVYSVHHGAMVAVPVVRVNRTPVSGHHVMRVALRTGAVLEISPGHPMADGRRFATLRPGDALDGVVIDGATLVPYAHDATYDILPDSDTGTYFAGGVLIGSTLAHDAVPVEGPTAPMSR